MAMKELRLSVGEQVFGLPILEWLGLGIYTVPAAAELLDVDRQRIYQLIAEDVLEGGRFLDSSGELIKVVVSKRSVEAYMEYRKRRAAISKPSFA